MNTPDDDIFAESDFDSEDLTGDLPQRLELLTYSHRSFAVRAAQELYRAERYRQYLSLIVVRGDLLALSGSNGSRHNNTAMLQDMVQMVRGDCRTSDLVSGVEASKFAMLLVETSPEGAQQFLLRLEKTMDLFLAGGKNPSGYNTVPVEVVSFPDPGTNAISLGASLETLYRRANVRS